MNTPEEKPDLIIDDQDRYSRLRLIGWWQQEKIAAAKILVVGAGALGNEVIKNLCLLGIGKIYVIDFDHVQSSNLSRSVLFRAHHEGQPKAAVVAEMAADLNPDCEIIPIDGNVLTDIGLGLVDDIDVVIGCLDNREARLWVNRMCWKVATPWIDGGIQEINGVTKVFMPPHGACYECAMTENDYKLISLRYSCPLLKQEDVQQGRVPTSPTIASIIGGMQVQEALKLLHSLPTDEGAAMVFNGAANNYYKSKFTVREDCLSHETYEDIVPLPVTHQASLAELVEAFRERYPESIGEETPSLILDRDFLIELNCRGCDQSKKVNLPLCLVGSSEGLCESCAQPLHPVTTCEIDLNSELASQPLKSTGVPDRDILKLRVGEKTHFISLESIYT